MPKAAAAGIGMICAVSPPTCSLSQNRQSLCGFAATEEHKIISPRKSFKCKMSTCSFWLHDCLVHSLWSAVYNRWWSVSFKGGLSGHVLQIRFTSCLQSSCLNVKSNCLVWHHCVRYWSESSITASLQGLILDHSLWATTNKTCTHHMV